MSVKVNLIAKTNVHPSVLSSHAALGCYKSDAPILGKDIIDVEKNLFNTGHHTTLQHNYYTFEIDNIPVSSVCLGLHLASPFYNTDQRSGRFSTMYNSPDLSAIESHIKTYYPDQKIGKAISFIENGTNIYSKNINLLTEIAAEKIKSERPFASEEYIKSNAPKFAQEQLRMFISMIATTWLDYTINLSSLAALHRTAWTPEMRDVIAGMIKQVVQDDPGIIAEVGKQIPGIEYMFKEEVKSNENWAPEYLGKSDGFGLRERPSLKLLEVDCNDATFQGPVSIDSVDTLYFSPLTMDNNLQHIKAKVEVSCGATFGQDQRHRTIKRGRPSFTGNFYVPPLVKAAGLDKVAHDFMGEFHKLATDKKTSAGLAASIAPYGAMVSYIKKPDMNALLHEQAKRTCWCAQEEIYHINTDLRSQIISEIGAGAKIVKYLSPACFANGKCIEGSRFCGRSIKDRLTTDYFKDRQI